MKDNKNKLVRVSFEDKIEELKELAAQIESVYNEETREKLIQKYKKIAELKLIEAVLKGKKWAIEYFLSTHGKDMGYGIEEKTNEIKIEGIDIQIINKKT